MCVCVCVRVSRNKTNVTCVQEFLREDCQQCVYVCVWVCKSKSKQDQCDVCAGVPERGLPTEVLQEGLSAAHVFPGKHWAMLLCGQQ